MGEDAWLNELADIFLEELLDIFGSEEVEAVLWDRSLRFKEEDGENDEEFDERDGDVGSPASEGEVELWEEGSGLGAW